MEKLIHLTSKYIQVKREESDVLTFGGDQNFFNVVGATKEEMRKKQSGCGIVAFADLLLYLGGKNVEYQIDENKSYVNRTLVQKEYKEYFDEIYSLMGGIPFKGGVSGFKLWFRFNCLARKNKWKLRAKWGFDGKKLDERIEEMLLTDIPVICCIPMMLLKKDKEDRLCLYHEDGSKACYTSAHYVTITGIVKLQNEVFYEISSWGKKYYINRKEYNTYIHNHFMGTVLGNILYIRKK